jgi:flagellar biosynthesis component FlhA
VDRREKVLYHQIHPLKLLTDWGTAFIAVLLLWRHRLVAGLVVGLIPPIIVSAALVRWADLEPLKQSAFGRYVSGFMTHRVESVRLLGMIVVCIGAWYHMPTLSFAGLATILLAWASGWWKSRAPRTP